MLLAVFSLGFAWVSSLFAAYWVGNYRGSKEVNESWTQSMDALFKKHDIGTVPGYGGSLGPR